MNRWLLPLSLALLAACAVRPYSALAGHADYKTPVRLHQLAKLDAEVKYVGHRHWQKPVSVHLWHGSPYIVVSRDAQLSTVAASAHGLLVQRSRHRWELRAPLFVVQGATLAMQAPSVQELRLDALPDTYATIVAFNSNVRITGSPAKHLWVHSWDPRTRRFDNDLDNGRGSVSVRGVGKLVVSYGTFSYLGFTFGRASGVSVNGFNIHTKGSGAVDHSTFAHNVFGAYTWEAKNMRWTDNRFIHNIVYGFDPHDRSNYFVVKDNYAAENGRHGIIFSRFCFHNLIEHNVSVRNGWHGIVIDDGRNAKIGPSARNVVINNVVRDNKLVGISIDGSNHNLIRGNKISGSVIGIRIFGRSYGQAISNTVVGNTIHNPHWIGILIADPAIGTRLMTNTISGSIIGVAEHRARNTEIADSEITGARLHAVSLIRSTDTRILDDDLSGSGPSAINKVGDSRVYVSRNYGSWNYPLLHDVARLMSWFVGPGLWGLLFLIVVIGPTLTWLVERTFRRRRQSGQPPSGGGMERKSPSDYSANADAEAPLASTAVAQLAESLAMRTSGRSSRGNSDSGNSSSVLLGVTVAVIGWKHRRLVGYATTLMSLCR